MADEQKPKNNPSSAPASDAGDNPQQHQQEADDDVKHTEQLPKTGMLQLPTDPKPMPSRQPTGKTSMLTDQWKLIFQIGDDREILPIDREIIIGRRSESGGAQIDFDLTPYGAYHFGVSRKHAIISLEDGYLYIEDLGSTNGTRINGFQLTAHQKYRLRDNDELEFARLRTVIRFRDPEKSS